MIVFYSSRTAARSARFGVLVDAGPTAPTGKRYGRKLPGIGGNSKQRRQALRAVLRQTH